MPHQISEQQALEIAVVYANGLRLAPFEVEGAMLGERDAESVWLVFLTFIEEEKEMVGLPNGVIVTVNASTGMPTVTMNL